MTDDWDAYEHRPGGVRGASRVGLVNPRVDVGMCACGVEIVVTRRRENDLIAAILTHQETEAHQSWRERKGIK